MNKKLIIFDDEAISWEDAESKDAGIVLAFDGDNLLGSVQYDSKLGYTLNVCVGGLEYFVRDDTKDSLKDIYYRIKEKFPNVTFKFYPINEYLFDSNL